MIVDVALEQALRNLKLSGMLHTLEARLAQARTCKNSDTSSSCRRSATTRSVAASPKSERPNSLIRRIWAMLSYPRA